MQTMNLLYQMSSAKWWLSTRRCKRPAGNQKQTHELRSPDVQPFSASTRSEPMRPSPSNLRRPLPSSYELHRQVQRERSLATNALLRSATGQLVYSMGIVARRGVTLARQLINEWRRRREIRALLQFDDRALADMGLGRSEIEFVVRTGGHLANEVSLRE